MKLTKNEKLVLLHLINEARATDTAIARKIDITLQAVRKIRKKLETEKIIRNYSVELNYQKLGITTFSFVVFQFKALAWEELTEEQIIGIISNRYTHSIWRIPRADKTHIVLYNFCSFQEMNDFFFTFQSKHAKYVNLKGIYSFSNNSHIDIENNKLVKSILSNNRLLL